MNVTVEPSHADATNTSPESGAERSRLASMGHFEDGLKEAGQWAVWGPYLSERAWGTVREDYSADGDAWTYFPHDHARSRSYRWNEEGLAGLSTLHQDLCFSLALWNGRDPYLKERLFGLDGHQGNHGEDAKEYWWYTDATPTHSYLEWLYHYPQQEFPYQQLIDENAHRDRSQQEYELLDTGVFNDDRYWSVEATYAKSSPTDLYLSVQITNKSAEDETIHVLPQTWFRDTWSFGIDKSVPAMYFDQGIVAEHWRAGVHQLDAAPASDGTEPTALFCENSTNRPRVYNSEAVTPYPKDGINDHVVSGAATINPDRKGTKAAWWYELHIPAGQTVSLQLRLWSASAGDDHMPVSEWAGEPFDRLVSLRKAEADDYYAEIIPETASEQRKLIARQAMAGMIWNKQFYRYDVPEWLDGDPGEPAPPPGHAQIRNTDWRHFDSADILSMPDAWEYPWFAAWDLAFHTIPFAHVDPLFAKYQILLLCREWFMHPNGAIPAYEWNFSDVNPPVHAWAALEVFTIDGSWDFDFLERVFHKLLLNFTWWVNREDPEGKNVFEGGFLGLDNIGAVNRSNLPEGVRLDQSDGTAWMAFYALTMLKISQILAERNAVYRDMSTKFAEHFAAITEGIAANNLWDPADGFFYDQLVYQDGTTTPLRVRSIVGVIPVLAALQLDSERTVRQRQLRKRFAQFLDLQNAEVENLEKAGFITEDAGRDELLLSVVDEDRLRRVLSEVLDEEGMLSPFGIRSLSKHHKQHPFTVNIDGEDFSVDYEPGESTTPMFGGNSNWRGPIWFPVNFVIIEALERYHDFYGDDFTVEFPTRSGHRATLKEVADDLKNRLVSLFEPDESGKIPAYGEEPRYAAGSEWAKNLHFFEYFDADTGRGLGASHQTGWTGLVADLIVRGLNERK